MKKMKNGFLLLAIATVMFVSCQKETGSNNDSSTANTGTKTTKIGTFSSTDGNGNTVYTETDWTGQLNGHYWLQYTANMVSDFMGATPNPYYQIVETYTTHGSSGESFLLQNDNGINGVQNVKTRAEIKYPYYIVDPSEYDSLTTVTGKTVTIGGEFLVGSYASTPSNNIFQDQACVMQAVECNNKPQIQVLAHPKYNLIEVVISGNGITPATMTYTTGGKYFWDNFSGGQTTGIFFRYSNWSTAFKINLNIKFTQHSTGYVVATLNGGTSGLITSGSLPTGAASNNICYSNTYNGGTFFTLDMPSYTSSQPNAGYYSHTNTASQGIAWSFGDYADYHDPTNTYKSYVYVSQVWEKGSPNTTLLQSDFDLYNHTNSFPLYTLNSPYLY